MFKLTGAVMIIAAGGLIGAAKSSELKVRAENLRKLISSLTLLENEIAYGKIDMRYALSEIGKIQNFCLFSEAAEYMKSTNAADAFMLAAGDKKLCFREEDVEILRGLADNLGMTGSGEQIKMLSHTKTLLENVYESAHGEYDKNGKLYRSTGILGGIFVAILLL